MSRINHFLIRLRGWLHKCITIPITTQPVSDHSTILLEGRTVRKGMTPFRFENMWLKIEGFKYIIMGNRKGINLVDPVASL